MGQAITLKGLCKRTATALTLGTVLFSLAGCGSKGSGSSATISMSFPDWKQMRQEDLSHASALSTPVSSSLQITMLAINVTASDISPVVSIWNAPSGSAAATATPPTDISLSVPQGSNRVVQVLAMYGGNGGGMAFYYADAVVNMNSSSVAVSLTPTNVAASQNLTQGKIVGRFFSSGTGGYTGQFQYRFNPPGKPSMVVHTGEMFNGWAKIFALSTNLLAFTKPDGTLLFLDGMTNVDSRLLSGARAAQIAVPAGFQGYSNNGGSTTFQAQAQQSLIVGFFGPSANAANENVYVAPLASPTPISDLYASTAVDGSGNPSDPLLWTGLGAHTDTTHDAYVVSGGTSSATNCQSSDVFSKCLKIDGSQLGNDSSYVGLAIPYVATATQYGSTSVSLTYSSSANTLSASWNYLPGVTSVLKSSVVYYNFLPSGSGDDSIRYSQGDGYICDQLASLGYTGQEVSVSASPNNQASFTGVPTIPANQFLEVVVCPKGLDGNFFHSGASTQYNSGGGSSGPGMATKLAVTAVDPNISSYHGNTCVPFIVTATDASGNAAYLNSTVTYSLSVVSGSVGSQTPDSSIFFYSTPDCSSSLTGTLQLSPSKNSTVLFMKRGASTSTSTTVTATDNSSALTSTSWALNFDANTAGSPAVVKLLMIGPVAPSQTIIPGGKNGLCNNFVIEYLDAWGALTTSYSSGIKLNSSSGSSADLAGVDLWPDYNSCQSGTTPASYIAQGINGNIGLYFGSVDYRGSSGVFQSSVTLFSGLTSSGLSPTNGTVSVQVPSTLSTLAVGMQDESNGTANITTSVCTPVFIDLYDSSGNATTSGASATEQITLSSSSSSLKLWYASNCTGTNASSVSIQADQFYANPLYVQSSAPGSYTISATAPNGATGSLNVTSTVSAAGVATTHLVMALQGQTFISGIGVTGYATEVEAGTALTATVYALTASNTIDTTNTNTVNFTTTSGSASFGSASAALSSGTATVSVTINGSGATLQATDSLSHTASDTITAAPAGQVPVQASVYGILPQSTALSDVCNAMMITSENQNGIAVQVSAQQSVYFQSTNLNVYLDSSCTSQISNAAGAGSTVIPAGQTATAVYVKAASGASTGANASFSLANGGNLPPSGSAYTTSATLSSSGTYSSTANYKIQKFGPPNILRNACSPVLFVGLTDLSVSYPFGTDTINSNTPNCSTGNPVAPAYYTDPACTSPAGGSSTVVFSGSSARAAIFYMQIGTGSGAATACSFSDSLNPSQFNIGTVPGFTFSVQTSY